MGPRTLASLFSGQGHAAAYAAYRPSYPRELFRLISDFAGPGSARGQALDLGCGTGQVAAELGAAYERVVGIDPSAAQVAAAAQAPNLPANVEYLLGPAEAVPRGAVAAGAVDLITCAQALHWCGAGRGWGGGWGGGKREHSS